MVDLVVFLKERLWLIGEMKLTFKKIRGDLNITSVRTHIRFELQFIDQ